MTSLDLSSEHTFSDSSSLTTTHWFTSRLAFSPGAAHIIATCFDTPAGSTGAHQIVAYYPETHAPSWGTAVRLAVEQTSQSWGLAAFELSQHAFVAHMTAVAAEAVPALQFAPAEARQLMFGDSADGSRALSGRICLTPAEQSSIPAAAEFQRQTCYTASHKQCNARHHSP